MTLKMEVSSSQTELHTQARKELETCKLQRIQMITHTHTDISQQIHTAPQQLSTLKQLTRFEEINSAKFQVSTSRARLTI